jgi:hypothetical protein
VRLVVRHEVSIVVVTHDDVVEVTLARSWKVTEAPSQNKTLEVIGTQLSAQSLQHAMISICSFLKN